MSAVADDHETGTVEQPTPPRTVEEALVAIRDLGGWLTDDQARLLWEHARGVPAGGRIVEIGSFQGRSTIILAAAAPPGVDVIAIDPHAGNDRGPQEVRELLRAESEQDSKLFLDNLERTGLRDRVRYVRKFSNEALYDLDGEVSLLYIDGAHRYRPARDDMLLWGSRVPLGGVLLVHDAFNAVGVTLAQAVVLALGRRYRYERRSNTLAVYRRIEMHGRERARHALLHLREVPYTIYNQILKVMIIAGLKRYTRYLGHPSGEWPY